ncbi:MAG: CDP-alcohol phosphatidyltransferase family protein [Bacilli bacterium]
MDSNNNKNKNKGSNDNFKAVLKKYFRKEDLFLLPNVLCYLRIILILAFLIVYFCPLSILGNSLANIYIASYIMAIAVYTDFLDGFIARKFSLKSNIGQILDPIADKLSQFAIALAITIRFYQYPSILLLLIAFVLKEAWMLISVILLARKNRSFGGAKLYGKVATFITYVILGIILIAGPFIINAYQGTEQAYFCHIIFDSLASIAILFLMISMINYSVLFNRLIKGEGSDEVSHQKENL